MALFDLRPKSSREDLFDREAELDKLHKAVEKRQPLVVVLGVRRIGKTSVLKTFLSEVYGVYIDMRGVAGEADLYSRVADAFSSSIGRLKRFLEGVRGVSIGGFGVEFRWRGRDSISFTGLLNEINKKGERFVVALDEVQSARPPLTAFIRNAIAYAYDNLEDIVIVVAGSEIGMLRSFLRLDDPSAPLYGRYAMDIVVERFSPDLSREFLLRGFREEGVDPPTSLIEEAVEFFDGIVGWLVLLGRLYIDGVRDFEEIKRRAIDTALNEIDKLGNREKAVLKAVAENCRSWSRVRDYIASRYGVVLPKSTLSRIIEKLENLSIIRDFEFLDPIYREASKRLLIRGLT